MVGQSKARTISAIYFSDWWNTFFGLDNPTGDTDWLA